MARPFSRRDFLGTALSLPAASLLGACAAEAPRPITAAMPLGELDATATAEAIRSGGLTAREAVEAAIRRAETVEPSINAIVTADFDAARGAADRKPQGPFAGVPTFIKDLDDVRGLPTHFGSRAFGQSPAESQAPYMDALQAAGLVFLGKSATPEFGLTATTEPLFGGPTRNPWNTGHSSGGSSGGAAALVASRVVPIAHATDGGGSIRIPASCCGVFGLKPSRGRFLATGRAAAGPVDILTSNAVSISVRDSARWLAITERTGSDRTWDPVGMVSGGSGRRFRVALDLETLRGTMLDGEVRAAVEDTAARCETLGHTVEVAPLPLVKPAFYEAFVLYWASAAAGVVQGLSQQLGRPPTEQELEPLTLELAGHFRRNRSGFEAAVTTLRAAEATCAAFFERYDLLLTPVTATPPPPIGYLSPALPFEVHMERLLAYVAFTPVQNAAGTPAMSVPLHWSGKGLPIGSHFVARAGDERSLLELAYQLEEAYPWAERRPPTLAS
jgi:amidase